MFSFFRRSKKETDSSTNSGSSSSKKSKDKETAINASTSPARNNHKETCKNNIQNVESAPQCANVSSVVVPSVVVATEVPLPKTVESETASVSSGGESSETNTKNDDTMSVSSKAQVYANMLKTLDHPSKETTTNNNSSRKGGVKPCGHGTVAIAPKIPLAINKQSTPPDSPKAETRNKLPFYYKPPNETTNNTKPELLHNKNNNVKYELVKTQPINDTVTGVMKLRVDIPPPSPPAVSNTTPNSTPPPPAATVDSEKYVLSNLCRMRVCAIFKTLDASV